MLFQILPSSGPVDALHLFDQDPFNYPMKDEVLAVAWDWIVQPTSRDRANYYSAHEGEEEQELVPDVTEEVEQPVGNGIQPGRESAGKGIAAVPKTKSSAVGLMSGGTNCGITSSGGPDCRVEQEDYRYGYGGPNEKPKQVISVESATWILSYAWICSQVRDFPCRVAQGAPQTHWPRHRRQKRPS